MPSYKLQRDTEDIRRELTDIFRQLKDPRVAGAMLSIVRVELSNDHSYCKVYVSALEGMARAQKAAEGLNNAAGFVHNELRARLSLRHVPTMVFAATDSIEYSAEISRKIEELKKEDEARGE
mgnify:CR=1 FL=1